MKVEFSEAMTPTPPAQKLPGLECSRRGAMTGLVIPEKSPEITIQIIFNNDSSYACYVRMLFSDMF